MPAACSTPFIQTGGGSYMCDVFQCGRTLVLLGLEAICHAGRPSAMRAQSLVFINLVDPPPCAGIGDESGIVLTCWDCLVDIGAQRPRMPMNACVNDNWVGRERAHVREASQATHMLASAGRCCWKQLRLGRPGDPTVQEKALTGNTIFFAQPTANVPSMELPHRWTPSWTASTSSSPEVCTTRAPRSGPWSTASGT